MKKNKRFNKYKKETEYLRLENTMLRFMITKLLKGYENYENRDKRKN